MGMFDSIFGSGSNGSYGDAYNQYAGDMNKIGQKYDPWINAGAGARDMNLDQYKQLINDPNFLQDKVTRGFQESPYQNELMDRVTKRMNFNSANTGMLGSGSANRALQDELEHMSGQFLNDYIGRGMNSYNRGLQGNDMWGQMGQKALDSQSSFAEQEAAARMKGMMSEQEGNSNDWGDILGGIGGAVAGGIFGGPGGAAMGSKMGSSIFGNGGGQGGQGQGGGGMFGKFFGGGNDGSAKRGINGIWEPNSMGGYTQSYGSPGFMTDVGLM